MPCLAGARVLLTDRWDPEACVELIEREGGTYMAGATPFLRGVLDAYAGPRHGSWPLTGPAAAHPCRR